MRLIVTGGGTGGHTYPALTTVNALQRLLERAGHSLDVLWVGAEDGLEARIAAENDIAFESVAVGKIRRAANPIKMLSRE
ncbi:MAG TPA: glycosyltransferase, partial [Candidatus Nocardiopsis merdipullorum]|nr:glycosyltransferase [Candidatus Nocardiopsis merdipullorum]